MGENTTIQQEPVYLTYGGSQIEQLPLFDALATNVQAYISEQPWSKKKKERFMSAYSDILSKGIVGANNTSGEWALDLGQVLDLDSLPKKDKEMYHEAAYYILEQMKGIPTVENKKEEDKKNLQLYTNDLHNKALVGYIGNNLFGGRNWDYTTDWDVLDKRDEKTGILSTSGRMAKLADVLEGYSNSLEEGKYNFEGTAFKDLNDLKTRLNTAATALRSGVMDLNVIDSLNMAGINWREYLHDGSEETVTLQDGTTMTRGEYNKAKAEQEAAIAEKEAAEKTAAEQQRALALKQANAGVLDLVGGIRAVEARSAAPAYAEYLSKTYGVGQLGFNNINATVQGLLEKGRNNLLTAREKKLLGNLLYYIRTNNPNYNKSNISDFEWQELNKYHNLQSKNRNGFVRLPWQTSDGRYTFADDRGNVYYLKPQNQLKLGNIKINRNNINNYRNNFLKSLLQLNNEKPVLSQDTDILVSDVVSMLGDIVSLGGGYAGAAGGITTLLSDLYGDIRRGKDTWSTIKNLGANLAWGAAGLIPGAKLGKLAKTATRIYALLQSAGIVMNDDVQQSWKNLIAGKPITAKDFENFKWTLHAITGGTNAVRGHFTERNVAKQVKINNKPTIETKSGKKVTLTEDLVKKINRAGGRKGQKAAEEAFKKATGEEAKEGTFNFLENARAWYNPNRHSQRLRNWTSDDERLTLPKTTQSVNTQAANKLLEIDKAKPIFAPFSKKFWTTPELRKSGNPFNKRFWTEGGPNRGGLTWAMSPYKTNNSESSKENKPLLGLPLLKTKIKVSSQSESSKENKQPLGLPLLKPKKPYTSPSSESVTTVNSIAPLKPYETPIKLNKDLPRNYGKVNLEEREIIESLQHSYGLGGLQKTLMYKGFGGSDIKSGTVGEGSLKFTLSRTLAKEIRNNPGKIAEFRNNIAKQVLKALDLKKINNSQAADLILKLKKKGFLRLGGQLNYSMEDKITNFLKTKI